jgi:hypothetical protein
MENVKFVELHCSKECLWNTTSVTYESNNAREGSYKYMVTEVG